MTSDERALLVGFLDQLIAAQAGAKDAEAEALIAQACARQPDACYLLTQRALQLEQALRITQAEVSRLQAQAGSGGFLGNANAWGASSATTTPSGARVSAPADSPVADASGPRGAQPQRFGGGMLGNAAAAAAGVVAGSFIFQGVQRLLGREGDAASWGAASPPPDNRNLALADPAGDGPEEDPLDAPGWDDGGDGGDLA